MLVLAIVALEVPLSLSLARRVDAEVRSEARSQADIAAALVSDSVTPPRHTRLRALVRTAQARSKGRVIVVDSRGRILADSAGAATRGADYRRSRPEIDAALSGRPVQDRRRSRTLKRDILTTAAPIVHGGRTVGVLRITQSVGAVQSAVRRAIGGLVLVGLVVLLVGLAAGLIIAGQVTRPLRRLELAARRVAGGDLEARAEPGGSSEQRTLARAFNNMTARLGRALRAQQAFVADASHQLRTPLTGLRLRLEEAEEAGVSGPAARHLAAATKELDRLTLTIDELLVLSRAGERDAPAEEVVLGAAAARARDRWGVLAAERGLRLQAASPNGSRAAVTCAPADLDRALDALIENALGLSAPGGTVTIAADPERIEVLDEGPGLEPGEEEAVFERFHRGSAGRSGPAGTGLGLPIARELGRRWGAEVTLANREGGGARARIDFAGSSPGQG